MTDISKIQVGQSSYDIKDEEAARISHTHQMSDITGLSTVASDASKAKADASAAIETANAAKAIADATATLIRPYVNGVLVANTNAPVGALVNANGSFDVVTLGWSSKGEPKVQVTLCSFEDDCATIGNNAVNGQKGISTKWPLNVQNGMTVDKLSFSKTPEWHVGRHVDGKCDSVYCVQSGTVFWTVHIDDGWWPLPAEQWTSIGGSLFSDVTGDSTTGVPSNLCPAENIWFTAMNYNGNGFMGVIYPNGTAMLHPPNGTEGADNWSFSVSWPISGA